jgi:hypothetical protein
MPENRREQNGRASSARKLEKIGEGISVDKIERGFGRVRGPRGYVVVGTIIVVQVSSKLYGKFRSCDKQYLLFVVLCYQPGLSRFFQFRFCFAFFSCVLLSTFLVICFGVRCHRSLYSIAVPGDNGRRSIP